MGSIKDRNSMDLTETEDIKKRLQEYTEELYKEDFHDPDNQKSLSVNKISKRKVILNHLVDQKENSDDNSRLLTSAFTFYLTAHSLFL